MISLSHMMYPNVRDPYDNLQTTKYFLNNSSKTQPGKWGIKDLRNITNAGTK